MDILQVKCGHCGAIANHAGQCTYCHKDLGSVSKAIMSAALASFALSLIWIGIAVIFQIEFAWISMTFGLLISAAVIVFSRGSGPKY